MRFIGRFGYRSGRDIDKFDGVEHRTGTTGPPVVTEHALGYLEARVVDSMDVGRHTLYVGRLTDAAMLARGGGEHPDDLCLLPSRQGRQITRDGADLSPRKMTSRRRDKLLITRPITDI